MQPAHLTEHALDEHSESDDRCGSLLTVLLFSIAGRRCALPLLELSEIAHLPELVRPPGLPAPVAGFLSLGGTPVPVVDGGRLLGLGVVDEALYTPLVLLQCQHSTLALMVEEIEGIAAARVCGRLEETDSLNGCARAIIETPGGPVQVLAADRILLAEERERLASLAELACARLAALDDHADTG